MKEERKVNLFDLARFYEEHSCFESGIWHECENCKLCSDNNGTGLTCTTFIIKHPEQANEIISKWCEEHPIQAK